MGCFPDLSYRAETLECSTLSVSTTDAGTSEIIFSDLSSIYLSLKSQLSSRTLSFKTRCFRDFGDYEWFELWASSNYETGVEEDLEEVLNWEETQAGGEGCVE